MSRECLECGMQLPVATTHCPKCDSQLNLQSDGSVMHVDIAHNRETAKRALAKLEEVLGSARAGNTESVRIVVGSGLIREEVLSQLSWLQRSQQILDFAYDGSNTGAILVSIRKR